LWSQYKCVRYIQVFKYWIYYGSRLCSLDKGHLKNCVVLKYVHTYNKYFTSLVQTVHVLAKKYIILDYVKVRSVNSYKELINYYNGK
jgi:hypothetical protein